MRPAVLTVATAVLLGGCATGAPESGVNHVTGYNRRELEPNTPGLMTGPSGVWTVYQSDGAKSASDARSATCPAPETGPPPPPAPDGSCPAPAKPRTVLLPKP